MKKHGTKRSSFNLSIIGNFVIPKIRLISSMADLEEIAQYDEIFWVVLEEYKKQKAEKIKKLLKKVTKSFNMVAVSMRGMANVIEGINPFGKINEHEKKI